MQRTSDIVLTTRSLARSHSALNSAMWAVAVMTMILFAIARAEAFWLLAALVAGLTLSGSI